MAMPGKLIESAGISEKNVGQNSLWLCLELICFFFLLPLYILEALYRKLIPPKCKSLEGKVVLVTGAGRGLGKELALGFGRLGCKVACVDINQDTALDTAAEIVRDGEKAKAYFTNVAKVEEIKELKAAVTKDLGSVDILVNNASLVYAQRLENMSEEATRATVDVNILGYIWMVREFLGPMKERNAGHIVTISSISAHAVLPNASLYATSKWAITGFAESVRFEIQNEGYDNIHFTTVCPAFMDNLKAALQSSALKSTCLKIEEVAARTITAVRRNEVMVCIPDILFYMCIVCKMWPTKVSNWVFKLYAGDGITCVQELIERYDPIIKDTIK